MNEKFENVEFSRDPSVLNFSFYNFIQNPSFSEGIHFHENFHTSFNLNNLINQNKDIASEFSERKGKMLVDVPLENVENVGKIEKTIENAGKENIDFNQEVEMKNEIFVENNNYNDFMNQDEDYHFFNQENNEIYYNSNDNLENDNTTNTNNTTVNQNHRQSNIQNLTTKYEIFGKINHLENVKNEINHKKCMSPKNKIIKNPPSQAATESFSKEFFSQQINSFNSLNSIKKAKEEKFKDILPECSEGSLSCPHFDCYPEEKLKEEMRKYGMKPGSHKTMVKQLIEIWTFINLSIF
jgi:hypothetical protein